MAPPTKRQLLARSTFAACLTTSPLFVAALALILVSVFPLIFCTIAAVFSGLGSVDRFSTDSARVLRLFTRWLLTYSPAP